MTKAQLSAPTSSDTHDPMPSPRVDTEQAIMTLAAQQHGIVTRTQLLRAGVAPDAIDRRVRAKRLRALHRGVYGAGPLRAAHEREMAAVLACGGGALVSHRSAARLWGLLADGGDTAPVDVIVAKGDQGRRPGIRFHRIRTLRADEAAEYDGIAITTPARTLHDLASAATRRELERALAQAFDRDLTDRGAILSLLDRHVRHRGAARLRGLVAGDAQPALTRSEAEERFLELVRKARLPAARSNARVGGYEVDFYWREQRFIVEIDGFAFHSSAARFESDRRRDAVLAAAGVRVIRVTWRQLATEPEAVLARVAQALVLSNPSLAAPSDLT